MGSITFFMFLILWEIWTIKCVIQTIGESRSISEVHKTNLGARLSKNHQITVKLHNDSWKQDNFGKSNSEIVINRFINTS